MEFTFIADVPTLLAATPVEALTSINGDVVSFDESDTVQHCLSTLAQRNILAGPVTRSGACVGFIDTLDVVSYLAHVMSIGLPPDGTSPLTAVPPLSIQSSMFADQSIATIMQMNPERHTFIAIPVGSSLRFALAQLFRFPVLSIHRLAIVEPNPDDFGQSTRVVGVLTQSTMLCHVARHVSVLGSLGHHRVDRWVNRFTGVITVPAHSTVVDACAVLASNKIGAVGLVDDVNRLVGCFSSSDVKGLTRENFYAVFLPIPSYLKAHRAARGRVMTPPVTVRDCDSLETVLLKMVATSVHRVFMVDDEFHPIGVITANCILRILHEWEMEEAEHRAALAAERQHAMESLMDESSDVGVHVMWS